MMVAYGGERSSVILKTVKQRKRSYFMVDEIYELTTAVIKDGDEDGSGLQRGIRT
jgi:hypothetical protein